MSTSTHPDPPAAGKTQHPHDGGACDAHRFDELRESGKRLLEETQGLRAELVKQAQRHPMAAFGLAFTAGLLVARALRR